MSLLGAKVVFLHGISGSGMFGLGWLLKESGKSVTGTDTNPTPEHLDIFEIMPEDHALDALLEADVYIRSDAVPDDHPLYLAARKGRIQDYRYHEALGELAAGYTTVAVAGTHGKSSTTAFLAHILVEAGFDPTVLVGAGVHGWAGKHARLGKGKLFVIEADEYRDHFLQLRPAHAIVTTIDFDHPDFFADLAAVHASFQKFVSQVSSSGTIFVLHDVYNDTPISWPAQTRPVDLEPLPSSPIPGLHMRRNAVLAVATANTLGVPLHDAAKHLMSFPGLARRFELLGTIGNSRIFSDYGHHPAEIAATLTAAKGKYQDVPIMAIFEAHTLDRLTEFTDSFADALMHADGVVLYPPFIPQGRDTETSQRALARLAEQLQKGGKLLATMQNPRDLEGIISGNAPKYPLIIGFSAGELDQNLRKTVTNH